MNIRFTPLFLMLTMTLLCLGQGALTACCFLSLLLHEGAHAVVARHYGYHLDTITMQPYGAELSGEGSILLPKEEIFVALAGPITSLLVSVIGTAVLFLFPITTGLAEVVILSNLSIGVLNFLPVYPMDGGRVLYAMLSCRMRPAKAMRIVACVGLVVGILCCLLFCVGLFFGGNFTLATVSVFMIASAISGVRGAKYAPFASRAAKKAKSVVPIRMTAVKIDATILEAMKAVDSRHFSICAVTDGDNGIIAVADEARLERWAMAFTPETTLRELLEPKKPRIEKL